MNTSAPDARPTHEERATIFLDEADALDPQVAGMKASTLARLRQAGFRVPDGFVVPASVDLASPALAEALAMALGANPGPYAVRSSGVAEDRPDASYAGQYESVLEVAPSAVIDAIERVRRSSGSDRVASYHGTTDDESGPGRPIAVLVQQMVRADVAGVAFTADPLTGDRAVVVVSAVRGVGERLVGGEASGDEWSVVGEVATARTTSGVLDASLALSVATLARSVEAIEGGQQDIEWAVAGDDVHLLQARPMTALPSAATWDAGLPGCWVRSFRLGEWLGAPVTPLFESWVLDRVEQAMHAVYSGLIGIPAPEPAHAVVNGWYFYGFNFLPTSPAGMVRDLVLRILPRFLRDPRHVAMAFPPLASLGIAVAEREWRTEIGPRYAALVDRAGSVVDDVEPEGLLSIVDELATEAGRYFASLTMVAGYATKAELPLAKLYAREVAPAIGGSHLELLAGVGDRPPQVAPHAVRTLDWIEPTLGERGTTADPRASTERHLEARRRRQAAEERARSALASRPRVARRFERLLARAQRFGKVREEHVAAFTLAWPVMRRAVIRLGAHLAERGRIDAADDVFWLTRAELESAVRADADVDRQAIAARRAARQQQSRLVAPLIIGTVPPMFERLVREAEAAVRGATDGAGDIVGIPASPGVARGPARVVLSPDDGTSVEPGDVLVCPLTAPAWTPLFDRVAAIVTDTGGVAAHASIVAREYGLPAVVGTGDATSRIRNGQLVEVDGSSGTVRFI